MMVYIRTNLGSYTPALGCTNKLIENLELLVGLLHLSDGSKGAKDTKT